MNEPIYTAFYTRGTMYEQEAARLRASLEALGLPHDIRAIDDRGNWVRNAAYTAHHIHAMQIEYPDRPIVQLDADAVVWKRPTLFDEGGGMAAGTDIAIHWRRGHELLNGTIWLAPTDRARLVIEKYRDLVISRPECTNEQTLLDCAIGECAELLKIFKLPAGYCFIADIMQNDLAEGEAVVIEHLQASRVANKSPMLPGRERRLREIDGYTFPAPARVV